MKKGDFLIVFSVLLIAAMAFAFNFFRENGSMVVITKEDTILYEIKLSENKTIDLDGNTVKIYNNAVWVSKADCSNQICVNHKSITKKGESIVCLPNRVVIEIK